MPFHWNVKEHLDLGRYTIKWALLVAPMGVAVGSAVAFFLWSLELATHTQWQNPALLFFLPLAGIAIWWSYHQFGKSVEGGNNLVMEQIHEPGGGVPLRMTPLVLIGTVVTHLFGGSAGREGTAVQMGGSLASQFCRWFRLNERDTSILLTAGVAAGFGAVFGTPLAGAVFALEVVTLGRMKYDALVPCLLGSVIGDRVCLAWGIHHTHYHIQTFSVDSSHGMEPLLDGILALKVGLTAVAFGLASVLFAESTHGFQKLFTRFVKIAWLRPVAGAAIVIGITYLLGTRDYLGLGVTSPNAEGVSIVRCFQEGGATSWSWFWKLLLTALTLSCGFKGGEVTPLFFVGAALGNALAGPLGAPPDLMAGLGFVAVFAGATNTPLACTIMGIELFGSQYTVYLALACFLAYLFSGHSGIYLSQRIGSPKGTIGEKHKGNTLRGVRQKPQAE